MKKKLLTLSVVVLTASVALFGFNNISENIIKNDVNKDAAARIKRGEYLVKTIGCDDCHSPKKMGPHGPEIIPELRLSGFQKNGKLPPLDTKSVKNGWAMFAPDLTAAVGQWGISYGANLTPDQTGIGNWKEENFLRAIREGLSKGLVGNRPLLPPMPWFAYKNMSDEDLKSIFAYLKTIKPVNNAVPNPVALKDIK